MILGAAMQFDPIVITGDVPKAPSAWETIWDSAASALTDVTTPSRPARTPTAPVAVKKPTPWGLIIGGVLSAGVIGLLAIRKK